MSLEENTNHIGDPDQTLEQLRASEQKHRSLIDANGIGYVILSEDGRVLDANSHYVAFSGHTNLREILGRSIAEWTAEPEWESVAAALQRCLQDGCVRNIDVTFTRADGSTTSLSLDATVEKAGGTCRVLALCRDNTAHKLAEELWLRERQFSEAVYASAPFLLYEFDDQLRLTRWNKRAEEITGYSDSELHHKYLFEWISEDEVPLVADSLKKVRESGYATVEAHLITKGGETVPYLFTGVLLTIDGREFFAGIGIDSTPRELAERSLRESEARLRTLIENAPVPIGIGRAGVMLYANSLYVRMLGARSPEGVVGLPILHQFAPQCRDQVEKYVSNRDKELPAPSEYETMGLKLDGTQFPIRVAITRIQFPDGPVSLAFVTDMTGRKTAEEELRLANEQLKTERSALHGTRTRLEATLNALPDLLFEMDGKEQILDFRAPNPELLYVSPEQFLGKKMGDILPPQASKVISDAIEGAARTGQDRGRTYTLTLPDGMHWFELSVSRKTEPESTDPSYIALVRDITKRKRVEEDLAQANEQLRLEQETLNQKNLALQELVSQVSEHRQSIGKQIQANIQTVVLPILDRLAVGLDARSKHLLSLAENSLSDIVAPFVATLQSRSRKLTQRELELCDLIRRGHGSKGIAELRGCSYQTVIKQRKVIRKKLGIAGKDVNLASYLSGVIPAAKPQLPPSDHT